MFKVVRILPPVAVFGQADLKSALDATEEYTFYVQRSCGPYEPQRCQQPLWTKSELGGVDGSGNPLPLSIKIIADATSSTNRGF